MVWYGNDRFGTKLVLHLGGTKFQPIVSRLKLLRIAKS